MTSYDIERWAKPKTRAQFRALVEDPLLTAVFSESERLSVPVYLVGGVVRDLLLGRGLHDVDLVVPAARSDFERLLEALQQRVVTTVVVLDAERGVVRLVPRRSPEEQSVGVAEHLDFALGQGEDLTEDLSRRDLTLNALALDLRGRLYDPHGGLEHLRQQRLREVRPTAFLDDPLRCLRALRFSALLGFDLTLSTLELMQQARPGLDRVAGERVAEELFAFLGTLNYPEPTATSRLWERALFGQDVPSEPLAWADYQRWCGSPGSAGSCSEPPVREGRSTAALVGLGILLYVEDVEGAEPGAQRKRLAAVAGRLRLSRREANYLGDWSRAFRSLEELTDERAFFTAEMLWRLKRDSGEALPGAWAAALALNRRLLALEKESSDRFTRLEAVITGWGELRPEPLPFEVGPFLEGSRRQPGPWVKALLERLESDWRCRRAEGPAELSARAERYLAELSS